MTRAKNPLKMISDCLIRNSLNFNGRCIDIIFPKVCSNPTVVGADRPVACIVCSRITSNPSHVNTVDVRSFLLTFTDLLVPVARTCGDANKLVAPPYGSCTNSGVILPIVKFQNNLLSDFAARYVAMPSARNSASTKQLGNSSTEVLLIFDKLASCKSRLLTLVSFYGR